MKTLSNFPQHLGTGVFAHMASAAVVNQKAFKALETYLPNSHKMFKEVLECMWLGLDRKVKAVSEDFGISNLEDVMPEKWKDKGYTLDNFDKTLLRAYKKLKELFPGVYVNVNNNGKRDFYNCGLRDPDSNVGAANSAHKFGKALDLHHATKLLDLRNFCESEKGLELGIIEVEDRVSAPTWVHIGTREPQNMSKWTDRTKPYIFIG
jgi:uncharacterized protein YcbK (DUF882 family)